ncbi:related to sporulation-specific gene SPS2 [Fusarium torulosum]|uniref:Related to sporulation-specific gene SPS2 n=1 Tax=Fusarium torulosum TaxID=33205 RepID=A0AAE8MF03_9HYPO|nr:related to sporulation-specific gene SPS2 [Fusarium torulosum]
MHSIKLLSAIAALSISAVSAASTCTKDIKVTEPTPVISCDVVDADIIVDKSVEGNVLIDGPKEIKGNFQAKGAGKLLGISSNTITTIGGNFELENLESLNTLGFSSLKSLGTLSFIKLPRLGELMFGTAGVTKIKNIRITDTFISDLSGLKVTSVESFQIDNNRKMNAFNSDLVNVTSELLIFDNGNDVMEITMNKLETAAEIQISSAKSFKVPALMEVTKSLKLNANPELKSFSAPNLTTITETLSLVDMNKLTNVSFPVLQEIGGGFNIQNNTKLQSIDDFPKLEKVTGGIELRGSFEKVELPKLDQVSGSVVVTSTTDIKDFCKFFNDLKAEKKIDGKNQCTSNNKKANEGKDGGEETGGSSSSSDQNKDDSAAGMTSVNMAVLALAGVAAVAQLF